MIFFSVPSIRVVSPALPLERNAVLVGEPSGGHDEVHVLDFHHEVDGAQRAVHAHEATARVLPLAEG